MINGRSSPKISIMKPSKQLKCYGFEPFANGPYYGCASEPYKVVTASHAPELHWQLVLSRRGSPPKMF